MFYFNANKPDIVSFQNASYIRKPNVILVGGGVGAPLAPSP